MLVFDKVQKTYNQSGKVYPVIEEFSYTVSPGTFVSIFGPNGCGKSTLLGCMAGFESYTGSITRNNKLLSHTRLGFVFQNYHESMLPRKTVYDNIAIVMSGLSIDASQSREIVMKLLQQVGLDHLSDKYFHELSGGMKQLVSLCRAFAYQPEIVLMDEPFSALDYSMRMKSAKLLLDMRHTDPKTTLFVSHDVDEALFLSDQIVVLAPRPSTIKAVIDVTLPRPRSFDMITSSEFVQLRKKVLDLFEY